MPDAVNVYIISSCSLVYLARASAASLSPIDLANLIDYGKTKILCSLLFSLRRSKSLCSLLISYRLSKGFCSFLIN